jgi:hypothetical protein
MRRCSKSVSLGFAPSGRCRRILIAPPSMNGEQRGTSGDLTWINSGHPVGIIQPRFRSAFACRGSRPVSAARRSEPPIVSAPRSRAINSGAARRSIGSPNRPAHRYEQAPDQREASTPLLWKTALFSPFKFLLSDRRRRPATGLRRLPLCIGAVAAQGRRPCLFCASTQRPRDVPPT